MIGSMAASVIVHLGRLSDDSCASSVCRDGRWALPWLAVPMALALVTAGCRLVGPLFVSPAAASWVLSTPVDRAATVRPRLWVTFAAAAVLAGGLVAIAAGLTGVAAAVLIGLTGATALAAVALVGGAMRLQAASERRVGAVLAWLLATAAWVIALLVALGASPAQGTPTSLSPGWWVVLGVLAVLSILAAATAVRSLPRLEHRDLARGGRLVPALSGALAGLDLALLYDVLVAHRWDDHPPLRSRRLRARGPAVLIAADLRRMWRSPQLLVALAATVVVPYVAQRLDAGRATLLVAVIALFFATIPLLTGLRVLTRTPALRRLLPMTNAQSTRAALQVPGLLVLVAALATAPAIGHATGASPTTSLGLALAVGIGALASAVRWMTGRPPDYSRPLVSTPAGGVPTNLYGSALRGFDIALLVSLPLLINPNSETIAISVAISLGVIGYLTSRE